MISTAMGEVKCAAAAETGAEYIVSSDSSCLMHIQGLLSRQGKPTENHQPRRGVRTRDEHASSQFQSPRQPRSPATCGIARSSARRCAATKSSATNAKPRFKAGNPRARPPPKPNGKPSIISTNISNRSSPNWKRAARKSIGPAPARRRAKSSRRFSATKKRAPSSSPRR